MKKFICILISVLIAYSFSTISFAETSVPMPDIKEYGFIDCGDVKVEYGIYGVEDGQPLLLLPCNGADMHSFDDSILPEMAKYYKVITISPRGTGKTERGPDMLNFEDMAEDLVKVLDYLKIEKTNIFGFSDGGNLGMVFTVNHPERVNSLVIMGSNINPLGTNTFDQIEIIFEYIFLSIKAMFTGDEADILKRDIQGLMVYQPNLTFKDLKNIKVPVLNIYGEHDMIKRIHSKRITRSIDGAQELMIIDGGHSTCFEQTDTVINPALLEFYNNVPKI